MKKYFLILLMLTGIFSLTSCSSDEDDVLKNDDPILGTWTLTEINPPAVILDGCEEASVIVFKANNTTSGALYLPDNDCIPFRSDGSWENQDTNRYTITVPILGRLSGTVEFIGSNTFHFETTFSEAVITLTFKRSV